MTKIVKDNRGSFWENNRLIILLRSEWVGFITLAFIMIVGIIIGLGQRSAISPELDLSDNQTTLNLKISDHASGAIPLVNRIGGTDQPKYDDNQLINLAKTNTGSLVSLLRFQGEIIYRDSINQNFSWDGIKTLWEGIGSKEIPAWRDSGSGLFGGYGTTGGFQEQIMTVSNDKLYLASATSGAPLGYDGDCRRDTRYGTTIVSYKPQGSVLVDWMLDKRDGMLMSEEDQICKRENNGPQESKTHGSNNIIGFKDKLFVVTNQAKNCKETDCGIKSKYVFSNNSLDPYGKRSNWQLNQPADYGGDSLVPIYAAKGSFAEQGGWLYMTGPKYLYRTNDGIAFSRVISNSFIEQTTLDDAIFSYNGQIYLAHYRSDKKTEIKVLRNGQLDSLYISNEPNLKPIQFFQLNNRLFLALKGLPISSNKDRILSSQDDSSWSEISSLPFGTNDNRISAVTVYQDSVTNQKAIYLGTNGEYQKLASYPDISSPAQVWRSLDGVSYTIIDSNGFCGSRVPCPNFAVSDFAIYRDELYALTRNATDEAGVFNGERYEYRGSQLYKLKITQPPVEDDKAMLEINLPVKDIFLPDKLKISDQLYGFEYDSNGTPSITGGNVDKYGLDITLNRGASNQSTLDDYYRLRLNKISKDPATLDFKLTFNNSEITRDKLLNLEQYLNSNSANGTYLGGSSCESGASIAKTKLCFKSEIKILVKDKPVIPLYLNQATARISQLFVEGNVAAFEINNLILFPNAIALGGSITGVEGGASQIKDYLESSTLKWTDFSPIIEEMYLKKDIAVNTSIIGPFKGQWNLNSINNDPKNTLISPSTIPVEGKLWRVPETNLIFEDITFSGSGTIVAEGNVTFKKNVSCKDQTRLAIFAKGSISFSNDINNINCGAYLSKEGSITISTPESGSGQARGIFISKGNINLPNPTILTGPYIIYFDSFFAEKPTVLFQELLKFKDL